MDCGCITIGYGCTWACTQWLGKTTSLRMAYLHLHCQFLRLDLAQSSNMDPHNLFRGRLTITSYMQYVNQGI
jgi:hypothetical protein